ncbi:hypothetical protein [Spirosoma sordidisoli]|uniref:Uncharacterized protein n=1 Tax=Spirosoma sordidisoli TaxID=2502893 RepID=A0A4Q2UM94_9BACT|nr:hypothetical protein [Spirosoma sordidisoli]RYC70723.1 hypothetical protein EQG79_00795 [Spirosoma sordidisoli]
MFDKLRTLFFTPARSLTEIATEVAYATAYLNRTCPELDSSTRDRRVARAVLHTQLKSGKLRELDLQRYLDHNVYTLADPSLLDYPVLALAMVVQHLDRLAHQSHEPGQQVNIRRLVSSHKAATQQVVARWHEPIPAIETLLKLTDTQAK